MSRHRFLNPEGLAPASGFSYGVAPTEGQTVYLAGITGHRDDMTIDEALVDQFAAACRSVASVLAEAGGAPADVVSMTIYTSAIEDYRNNLEAIGEAYRAVFGKHYPAMALIGVSELFDPRAVVELVCVAVV
ncbi:MAG: RidA family protein [Acidimicrobiia bacterium]|nr:RidA family protein [Acidimicrobiia bacterium]